MTNSTAGHSAGTYGLAVLGSGTTQATVQTPAITPGSVSYHVRIAMNPNGLRSSSATTATGILTGLSGTTSAFQVQYRRGTTTGGCPGPAELRHGQHGLGDHRDDTWSSIQVDWVSGKKATLTLTVNGAASSLTGRNTSTLKVTAAQLGFRNATGAVTGTAYFDAFASSLNPLP